MVVSKDSLEELAFGGKLLINLNVYTSQADGVTTVDKAGIEALKSDSAYDNAFRPDGSPKTSWRDLTEQDIKALKALQEIAHFKIMRHRMETFILSVLLFFQEMML